jgi:murein endopeptidase
LGLLLGQASPTGRCYDLGFADHQHGLEVEVAKLFPGGSRTSATWRSRPRRLIVLHDTARMGAVGTAHKDPLPRRAPVRLDKQIDKQSFNRLRV